MTREFAERCFQQIEGFGEYGFPESHAARFALLVYASCWMKCRYPDVFACALLNAQPMGFYAPAQLVRDAREHGVEVREVDVNFSDWDHAAGAATRLQVTAGNREPGLHARHAGHARRTSWATMRCGSASGRSTACAQADMDRLVERARPRLRFRARPVAARRPAPAVLERLADADAFRSLGLDRREALWAVRGLNRSATRTTCRCSRAAGRSARTEPDAQLPPMPLGAHVVEDYRRLSLSLKAHPVGLHARAARRAGILRAEALGQATQRAARHGRGAGAGAPAAGHGQGRHLHDAGGRDGRRQHHRLAEGLRDACAPSSSARASSP